MTISPVPESDSESVSESDSLLYLALFVFVLQNYRFYHNGLQCSTKVNLCHEFLCIDKGDVTFRSLNGKWFHGYNFFFIKNGKGLTYRSDKYDWRYEGPDDTVLVVEPATAKYFKQ